MEFVGLTLSMALIGLGVGGLARFALPGRERLSLAWTVALGVVGTVAGAALGKLVFGRWGGLLLSVLVAMAILAGYRRIRRYRDAS
jgi:uncharacterized membrane protein YeaQ/YmgE (transglycosylase-associated protein family)